MPYAALFCAFRLDCAGERLSSSSSSLLPFWSPLLSALSNPSFDTGGGIEFECCDCGVGGCGCGRPDGLKLLKVSN
jgi:hypothetical protein